MRWWINNALLLIETEFESDKLWKVLSIVAGLVNSSTEFNETIAPQVNIFKGTRINFININAKKTIYSFYNITDVTDNLKVLILAAIYGLQNEPKI